MPSPTAYDQHQLVALTLGQVAAIKIALTSWIEEASLMDQETIDWVEGRVNAGQPFDPSNAPGIFSPQDLWNARTHYWAYQALAALQQFPYPLATSAMTDPDSTGRRRLAEHQVWLDENGEPIDERP